jgi:hypothetical protein
MDRKIKMNFLDNYQERIEQNMNIQKTPEYYKSNEDFTALGAMAPIKKSKKSNKKFCKGRKLNFNELGFRSHIDQLKSSNEKQKRSDIYDQLQDKTLIAERLTKTRLCFSVKKGVKCPHGKDKCKFAHSKEELRVVSCLFGDRCSYVCKKNSYIESDQTFILYNNKSSENKDIGLFNSRRNVSRICYYIHPKESKKNYIKRTGSVVNEEVENIIEKPKISTDLSQNVTSRSYDLDDRYVTGRSREREARREPGESISDFITELDDRYVTGRSLEREAKREARETISDFITEQDESIDNNNHAIYTVPKEIAIETFKSALEAGITKITITIV